MKEDEMDGVWQKQEVYTKFN